QQPASRVKGCAGISIGSISSILSCAGAEFVLFELFSWSVRMGALSRDCEVFASGSLQQEDRLMQVNHDEALNTPQKPCSIQPLSDEERQIDEDIRWAQQDAAVQATYRGEFVVPYCGQIVAHGREGSAVLAEAARVTGRTAEELPLIGVIDPLLD